MEMAIAFMKFSVSYLGYTVMKGEVSTISDFDRVLM